MTVLALDFDILSTDISMPSDDDRFLRHFGASYGGSIEES